MRKLIFIHHSCGTRWLRDDHGGLAAAFAGSGCFVSDTNYGWGPDGIGDHTDIGHWWNWFRGPRSGVYMDALFRESGRHCEYARPDDIPPGENEIILFKSCFPNSHLAGSAGDAAPSRPENPLRGQACDSEHFTVGNAKGIYMDILEYFKARQDKLFIAITAPPLIASAHAANARGFNRWLAHEWLGNYPYANVAVFDFYNTLTSNGGSPDISDAGRESGNHHRLLNGAAQHSVGSGSADTCQYPTSGKDSHPNKTGNEKATSEFIGLFNFYCQRWRGATATIG